MAPLILRNVHWGGEKSDVENKGWFLFIWGDFLLTLNFIKFFPITQFIKILMTWFFSVMVMTSDVYIYVCMFVLGLHMYIFMYVFFLLLLWIILFSEGQRIEEIPLVFKSMQFKMWDAVNCDADGNKFS